MHTKGEIHILRTPVTAWCKVVNLFEVLDVVFLLIKEEYCRTF